MKSKYIRKIEIVWILLSTFCININVWFKIHNEILLFTGHRRSTFPHQHHPLKAMRSKSLKQAKPPHEHKPKKKKKKKRKLKTPKSFPSRSAILSPTIHEVEHEEDHVRFQFLRPSINKYWFDISWLILQNQLIAKLEFLKTKICFANFSMFLLQKCNFWESLKKKYLLGMYLPTSQIVCRETTNRLFLHDHNISAVYYVIGQLSSVCQHNGFHTIPFVLVGRLFWNFNTMIFWHRIKAKIDWGIVDLPMSKQEALRCQQVCFLFFVCEVFIVHLFLMRFSLTSSLGKSLAEKCNYYRFFYIKIGERLEIRLSEWYLYDIETWEARYNEKYIFVKGAKVTST